MVRPYEFNRDAVLEKAMILFWSKGFAATSTEGLVETMGIGRQSLYNTFGDKRQLYLEALAAYLKRTTARHVQRLSRPASPIKGISNLLTELIACDDRLRVMGCMGVGSVGEFGVSDPEIAAMRKAATPPLSACLVERLLEGQAKGEINPALVPEEASAFIQLTMAGLQLAARGGAAVKDLKKMARFAVDCLKAV
jgi:TetR/AcrR family transcriptional repressor of nem operon